MAERRKEGAIKGLCEKETLWKGLCNNENNFKSKLTYINETISNAIFHSPLLQTIFNIARLTQIIKLNI